MKYIVEFPADSGQWAGRHHFQTLRHMREFLVRAERHEAPVSKAATRAAKEAPCA